MGAVPIPLQPFDPNFLIIFVRPPPWIVRSPLVPGVAAIQNERRRPLGMGRGEHHRHVPAFGNTQERRPFRAHGVHHGADIVDPLFQGQGRDVAIGQAHAAPVEPYETRETAQSSQEPGVIWTLPRILHVGDPALRVDQVDRPAARHLVGDREVSALGVLGAWRHVLRHRVAEATPWSGNVSDVWRRTTEKGGFLRISSPEIDVLPVLALTGLGAERSATAERERISDASNLIGPHRPSWCGRRESARPLIGERRTSPRSRHSVAQ